MNSIIPLLEKEIKVNASKSHLIDIEMRKIAQSILLEWIKNQPNENPAIIKALKQFKQIEIYIYSEIISENKIRNDNSLFIPIEKNCFSNSDSDDIICIFRKRLEFESSYEVDGVPNFVCGTLSLIGFIARKNELLPFVKILNKNTKTVIAGIQYQNDVFLLPIKFISTHVWTIREKSKLDTITDDTPQSISNFDELKCKQPNTKKIKKQPKIPNLKLYIFKQDGIYGSDTTFLENNTLRDMVMTKINVLLYLYDFKIPNYYQNMTEFLNKVLPMNTDEDMKRDRITNHFIVWMLYENVNLVNWFIRSESNLITTLIKTEPDPLEVINIIEFNNIKTNTERVKQNGVLKCLMDFIDKSVNICVSCYRDKKKTTSIVLETFANECRQYIIEKMEFGPTKYKALD
jgi:hypothetical protein